MPKIFSYFARIATGTVALQSVETKMQRILVIDDDVELCELVGEYLEPDGYKVEAVHEGHEGIRRALSGDHALVVLDYMLPGLNGFEVLRQIRSMT